MVFLLNKAKSLSHLTTNIQNEESLYSARRAYHIELGAREKALLAPDPSLTRFKSYKKGVRQIKRMGDILTIVVVAGCCYEIYVNAIMQEEARKKQVGGHDVGYFVARSIIKKLFPMHFYISTSCFLAFSWH